MKYFAVTGSPWLQAGLALAGVEGVLVQGAEEARQALERAAADPAVAVLVVDQAAAGLCGGLPAQLKAAPGLPLVVELPTPGPPRKDPDSPSWDAGL